MNDAEEDGERAGNADLAASFAISMCRAWRNAVAHGHPTHADMAKQVCAQIEFARGLLREVDGELGEMLAELDNTHGLDSADCALAIRRPTGNA